MNNLNIKILINFEIKDYLKKLNTWVMINKWNYYFWFKYKNIKYFLIFFILNYEFEKLFEYFIYLGIDPITNPQLKQFV